VDQYYKAIEQLRAKNRIALTSGWSIGPRIDSFEGRIYRIAGSLTRTPGEYFADLPTQERVTNECVHPMVWHAKDKLGEHIEALKKFQHVPNPKAAGTGYYWTATYSPVKPEYTLSKARRYLSLPISIPMSYLRGRADQPKQRVIKVTLPEFVIPSEVGGESDDDTMERGLLLLASRALECYAKATDEERKALMAKAEAKAREFLNRLDDNNTRLLTMGWDEIVRDYFPEPLEEM
jgi:hypothetical protein